MQGANALTFNPLLDGGGAAFFLIQLRNRQV